MADEQPDEIEGSSVFEDGRETPDRPDHHEEDETPATLERDHERGCPKCGHEGTETDTIATAGGGLSKFFDVQNRRFTVVSCTNCGYSELYRSRSSGDVIDVFLG